ncbi:MAG TPA: Fe-Mn family superoxide dismutase [Gemmatimonadota bacterium]|jgi:Fe-Mn family superoxide dismutase
MPEHEVMPLPFAYDALEGISRRTLQLHHDLHYAAHVTARNRAAARLAAMRASGDYEGLREVLAAQAFHESGEALTELFYAILGGDGTTDDRLPVVAALERDFGSFDAWRREFVEVALAARAWALLCVDGDDGRLRHALLDTHDAGSPWGFRPVLAADVAERAYYLDHAADRSAYLDAFLRNLSWKKIDEIYGEVSARDLGGPLRRGNTRRIL